jgi:hypothetical protein
MRQQIPFHLYQKNSDNAKKDIPPASFWDDVKIFSKFVAIKIKEFFDQYSLFKDNELNIHKDFAHAPAGKVVIPEEFRAPDPKLKFKNGELTKQETVNS